MKKEHSVCYLPSQLNLHSFLDNFCIRFNSSIVLMLSLLLYFPLIISWWSVHVRLISRHKGMESCLAEQNPQVSIWLTMTHKQARTQQILSSAMEQCLFAWNSILSQLDQTWKTNIFLLIHTLGSYICLNSILIRWPRLSLFQITLALNKIQMFTSKHLKEGNISASVMEMLIMDFLRLHSPTLIKKLNIVWLPPNICLNRT